MLTILYVMFQLSRDSTWCQASTPWKLCTISWRWRNLTISWRGPPLASLWPPFLHPHTVTLHWPHHTSPSQEHREGTNLPAILPPALVPLYQEWEAWSWVGSRKWPPTSSSDRTATRTSQIPASGPRVVSGARGFPVRSGDGEKTQRQMSWGSENQSLPLPNLDRCCFLCMPKDKVFISV